MSVADEVAASTAADTQNINFLTLNGLLHRNIVVAVATTSKPAVCVEAGNAVEFKGVSFIL